MSSLKYRTVGRWAIIPKSRAKPQPDYIPENIRKAYDQACISLEVNARASAVMSRYCIQEMLRDFWELPRKKDEALAATFDSVAEKVSPETRDAIETVRRFGNIDSYTQEDVRLMVDAKEEEAALLIDLVETLFKDFYEDQHRRKERFEALRNIAETRLKQGEIITTLPLAAVRPAAATKPGEGQTQQKHQEKDEPRS